MAFVSDFIANLIPEFAFVAAFVAVALIALYIATFATKARWVGEAHAWVKRYAVTLSFLVALAAMSGSLFYSEVRGLTPCLLCWFQRIFMYPQAFVFGLAALMRSRDAIKYGLLLSVPGFGLAIYHYLEQTAGIGGACSAAVAGQEAVACSTRYVFSHGFVSIPFMAVAAFALIIVVSLLALKPDVSSRHR